jgi:pimeloyl-ACP methyl ester carboxylesterase
MIAARRSDTDPEYDPADPTAVTYSRSRRDGCDARTLAPEELGRLSFHDPVAFAPNPATLIDARRAVMAANLDTLYIYGGPSMSDPGLPARLAGVAVPALVVWGASDGVVDADAERRYAAEIPDADFEIVAEAGHLPQLEQPEAVLGLIDTFIAKVAKLR